MKLKDFYEQHLEHYFAQDVYPNSSSPLYDKRFSETECLQEEIDELQEKVTRLELENYMLKERLAKQYEG